MAISQRSGFNPTTAAGNWATRVGASGAAWLSGIRAPRRLPNADPATNTANWLAGVANAGPSFNAGITAPDYLTRLENGAQNKQGSFTGAGAAHKQTFQDFASKAAAAWAALASSLPPKGPKGENTARSTAWQTGLHGMKGQFKVR